jgi:hypothetical protein
VANESLGVSGIGRVQDTRALKLDTFGMSEVDGGRGVEPNARMAVVVVVPPEEAPTEIPAVFNRAEAVRELWPVLEGFELGLRVRIVVGAMRTRVALADTQIRQE